MKRILFLLFVPAFLVIQNGCSAQDQEKGQEGNGKSATTTEVPEANSVAPEANKPVFKDISVQEFHDMLGQENLQVLDVRTPGETSAGTVDGAQTINLFDPNFSAQVAELDKNQPVAVYCKVGGRSKQAQDKMKAMGFKQVYNVSGGFDAWKASGYEVAK